jgi:hypothetical protein
VASFHILNPRTLGIQKKMKTHKKETGREMVNNVNSQVSTSMEFPFAGGEYTVSVFYHLTVSVHYGGAHTNC